MDLYDLVGARRRWQLLSLLPSRRSSAFAPIVIGGCGSSGTTLLRTALNAHPEIAAGPESTVFLRRVSGVATLARRFGLPADAIDQALRDSRSQPDFIERFAALWLAESGKRIWADKTPENIQRVGFVFRHFPQARFIHVIRDGRDVVCSLRERPWMKLDRGERQSRAGLIRCARYWASRVRNGLRHRGDPRYAEVYYEDLVHAPERTLRRVLDFLGLPWSDRVVDRTIVAASVVDEEGLATLDDGHAIHQGAIGRWQRELRLIEIAELGPLLTPLLVELGYIPAIDPDGDEFFGAGALPGFGD